jgi:hypothetical protein
MIDLFSATDRSAYIGRLNVSVTVALQSSNEEGSALARIYLPYGDVSLTKPVT